MNFIPPGGRRGQMRKKWFSWSPIRSLVGIFCFAILVIFTMWDGSQSLIGRTNLSTGEAGDRLGTTEALSETNEIKQGLFFHKPIHLREMTLYLDAQQPSVNINKIRIQIEDQSLDVIYKKEIPTAELVGKDRVTISPGDVSFRSNERYYLRISAVGKEGDEHCGPAFATMPEIEPYERLVVKDYWALPGQALMMEIQYDWLPMGIAYYVVYLLVFLAIFVLCNINREKIALTPGRILAGIWVLFFVGMFLAVCLDANANNLLNYSHKVAMCVIVFGIVTFVCLLKRYQIFGAEGFGRLPVFWGFLRRHGKLLSALYFSGLFLLQCFLVLQIFQKVGWDVNATWDAATWWQTHEDPMMGSYLLVYPNNIALCLLLYLIRMPVSGLSIASQYYFVVMINCICVDFGIYMCYRLAKKLLGTGWGVVSLVLLTALFGISGHLAVPYTDTITFFLPVFCLAIYLKLKEIRIIPGICLLSVALGALLIFGFMLKPQCLIVLIAIVMIEGVYVIRRMIKKEMTKRWLVRGAAIGLGLMIGGLSANHLETTLRDYVVGGYTDEYAVPMEHFLMMGLNEDFLTSIVGSYSRLDANFTNGGHETNEEKKEACRKEIVNRLKKFGVMGVGKHMYRKTIAILGDGTFFWQMENAGYNFWFEDFMPDDSQFRHEIREIYYGRYGGYPNTKFRLMGGVLSGIWFLMLLFFAVPVRGGTPQTKALSIVALAAFGCLAFTMLFEARSRYLINYLPMFTIAAVAGMARLSRWYLSRKK